MKFLAKSKVFVLFYILSILLPSLTYSQVVLESSAEFIATVINSNQGSFTIDGLIRGKINVPEGIRSGRLNVDFTGTCGSNNDNFSFSNGATLFNSDAEASFENAFDLLGAHIKTNTGIMFGFIRVHFPEFQLIPFYSVLKKTGKIKTGCFGMHFFTDPSIGSVVIDAKATCISVKQNP